MIKEDPPFPVDFVWTYCSSLRKKTDKQFPPRRQQLSLPCALVDDLKYSIRSVVANTPWFRNIILVVADDDCLPTWLQKDVPRLRVVKHSQFMPADATPCFNSNVIESYIHHINGLSEQFVYLNDDCYIGLPTPWTRFFMSDGKPIGRLCRGPPDHPIVHSNNMFVLMMQHAIIAYGMHNTRYQHNIQPFTRKLMAHYERHFADEVKMSRKHRHRQPDDFNVLRFTTCFGTHEGRMPLRRTSARTDYFTEAPDEEGVRQIRAGGRFGMPPRFFCINNTLSQHTHVYKLLAQLFPKESPFEIIGKQSKSVMAAATKMLTKA